MSCVWKLFKKQPSPLPPIKIPIQLNLDELPETLLELRAHEMALIDQLVSIHYQIEDTKIKISKIQDIELEESKYLLEKRRMLGQKKHLQERRLGKIREKLQEIRGSQ